ncbi:MAG: hypothetical protein ACI8S6_003121, partial [Myxococcota bacterium]
MFRGELVVPGQRLGQLVEQDDAPKPGADAGVELP